jgi:hypothetical protein
MKGVLKNGERSCGRTLSSAVVDATAATLKSYLLLAGLHPARATGNEGNLIRFSVSSKTGGAKSLERDSYSGAPNYFFVNAC